MKKRIAAIMVAVSLVFAFAVVLINCGGGGGGTPSPQGDTPGTTGMIMGTVKDTAGTSLPNVAVTAVGTGKTATTNSQGYYSISGLSASSQIVVNYSAPGYAATSKTTAIQVGQNSYLNAVMATVQTFTVNGATGGSVTTTGGAIGTVAGAKVDLPANALVTSTGAAFTGTATVTAAAFDPTTASGMSAFPGNFEGVPAAGGSPVPIESYGFIDVNITDGSGNQLKLASAQTATITIPIPASMVTSATTTIPLWYYDTTTGQWKEQGFATKSGSVYIGTVSHFTAWNVDLPMSQISNVTGTVVDGSGQPIQGARVEVRPTGSGRAWASGEDSTPADGTFNIRVGANQACEIWAAKNGIESSHFAFTSATSAVGTYDVGNIVLAGNPLMKITLTWGLDPNDLDAHLTVPMVGGSRSHVYYSNKIPAGSDAYLDTDDTSSYGPEIITVTALHDGVYRYSVHHYSGTSTISSSGASVSMFVDGLGIYSLTPPAGAAAVNDVWRLWDITVTGGRVTSVTAVNTYIPNVSSGDIVSFNP